MPKQELLREAVDDLLAMHNMGVRTLTAEILKGALRQSADLVEKLEQLTRGQAFWKRKCYEGKKAIDDALAELGIKNLLCKRRPGLRQQPDAQVVLRLRAGIAEFRNRFS